MPVGVDALARRKSNFSNPCPFIFLEQTGPDAAVEGVGFEVLLNFLWPLCLVFAAEVTRQRHFAKERTVLIEHDVRPTV
jgi:hypothetical protein